MKEIHGALDPAGQLPSPHDTARHQGQVPANGGVQFLLHVDAGDHFNVPTIVLQNALILLVNAKVWDAKSVFSEFEKLRFIRIQKYTTNIRRKK